MNPQLSPRMPFLVVAMMLVLCSACSTGPERDHMPASSLSALSLEDVMRIPLAEGEPGWRRIINELFKAAGYSHSTGTTFGSNILKAPITFQDGYGASEIMDYAEQGEIVIVVDKSSCFKIDDALRVTNAKKAEVIHGYQPYDDYFAFHSGILVSFTVVPPRLGCISSINIDKRKRIAR